MVTVRQYLDRSPCRPGCGYRWRDVSRHV